MINENDVTDTIFPSATVVLLRDSGQGLEALLVQRSKALKHLGGVWVFPGGKVDDQDHDHDRDAYRAALNAAIRETREEVGVAVRQDQLVYLSHWTTPVGAPKRFATWFFLAILEGEQDVEVDGGEIALHRWVEPHLAIAECADESEALQLMPPTYISLLDLVGYRSCAEAQAGIDARGAMTFTPRVISVQDGICFLYEGDAGYDDVDPELKGGRHRMYMIENQLQYIREP
ncbi:MAG: NUDIX hydrolase [Halieaceae bacterium]|jgi:8-oxo-dGTP pyrophosphatase MutT (NUDIX family)|nr:NUDIX hydrolase [Halieaceae bacterium]